MRAGVLRGPHSVTIDACERPEPEAGQVRIRLEGCGVCGSNLPVWEGRPWFQYPQEPGAPGHEGWGVVDVVGPGVTGIGPGTRVAAVSYHAFAEYDLAQASDVLPIPASLAGPFPAEPLACAVNVFRRADIQAGQTVAVIGIGFLGALLTQLAARAGARVIAISRRAVARETARACGAHEALPLDADAVRAVERLTGGHGCDRVIEAVGLQEPLDVAGRLTRIRGRLIIAGFHQDGPRTIDLTLWNWRGLDVINAHERDPRAYVDGMREALDLVVRGALNPAPLYTHRFPLADLGAALRTAAERPDGFLKALVLA